jgi:cation diffusion facilitator CzcD-associated flavoprotein CzcO
MAFAVVWTTPLTGLLERLSRAWLHAQVADPWLRRQLTPDFRLGCKRILLSNDWYAALQGPNCRLVTWPIARLSPAGLRTCEGLEHPAECIVFATGFDVAKAGPPMPIRVLDGRRLEQEWAGGAQAYKSVSTAGYPNLFLTFGPNSGSGHHSALVYLEAQIGYIMQGIRTLLGNDLLMLDVREPVQARHNRFLQNRLRRTHWSSGCRSWYLRAEGHNATLYPGLATQFVRQLRRFELANDRRVARGGAPATLGR